MAVGRPTIDPSWDDAGSAGATPNANPPAGGPSSNSQTPPPATPADAATPEETQAIEAARSALQEQPTHEQLEPLETLDDRRQTSGVPQSAAPAPSTSVPPISTQDAATILDAPGGSNPAPAPATGQVGPDVAVPVSGISDQASASADASRDGSGISSPTTPAQTPYPAQVAPQLATPSPAPVVETTPATPPVATPQPEAAYDPTVPTADTLAQSLDQPTETIDDRRQTTGTLAQPPAQPPVARIPQQQRTEPLPAAERHLPGYVKIILGLLFIVLLAAAVFLGSEAGYLSIGIERLWGISNSPSQALMSAATAVGTASSYTVDGEVSVTLAGTGDAANQAITSQFQQQVATPLSQLDSSWTVGPDAPGSLLGSRLSSGGSVRALMQSDGQALYVRLNEGDQTLPWTQTELAELEAFKLQPLQWQALLEGLVSAPSSKLLGGKTINDVKAKGYQVEVPIGTVLGQLSAALGPLSDSVTIEVWLDSKTALPTLMTIKGAVQTTGAVTGQLVFSGYDSPSSIVLPTAEQVTPGTLSSWLETNGIIGVQTAASRDATRRSNLDTIKQALEEFAAAQTPFGYPVTSGLIHLDADATVQAALAPYLSDIPKDPQQPDRYYGYQSDGQTYKVTAVAEEATGDDVTVIDGLKLITRTSQ